MGKLIPFNDPDFNIKGPRIIDLRPFFKENEDDIENLIEEDIIEKYKSLSNDDNDEKIDIPKYNELIISPAIRSEKIRESNIKSEQQEREDKKPLKFILLSIFLAIYKQIMIFFIEKYQNLEITLKPFETKYTEKQLFYLGISLPNTITSEKEILFLYPQLSRSNRYKLLNIKKNTLKMYQKIYEKK